MPATTGVDPRQPAGMPRVRTRVYMPDMRQGQIVSNWGPTDRPVCVCVDGPATGDPEYRYFPLAELVTIAGES